MEYSAKLNKTCEEYSCSQCPIKKYPRLCDICRTNSDQTIKDVLANLHKEIVAVFKENKLENSSRSNKQQESWCLTSVRIWGIRHLLDFNRMVIWSERVFQKRRYKQVHKLLQRKLWNNSKNSFNNLKNRL